MKLASVVLFLLSIGASHGAKDAVKSECSRHDNGAMLDPDSEKGEPEKGAPMEAETPDETPTKIESTADEEEPAVATPEGASEPDTEELSDNNPTVMEEAHEEAHELGELLFNNVQQIARQASANAEGTRQALKALRWAIRYSITHYGVVTNSKTGTVVYRPGIKQIVPLRVELTKMIMKPEHMNEVFAAISAESVTYEGLKKTLGQKARHWIEGNDKAMRIVGLIFQASDALARLGHTEWFKKYLASGTATGYLAKGIWWMDKVVKTWNSWGSSTESEEDEKVKSMQNEVLKDPDHDEHFEKDHGPDLDENAEAI